MSHANVVPVKYLVGFFVKCNIRQMSEISELTLNRTIFDENEEDSECALSFAEIGNEYGFLQLKWFQETPG